MRFGPERRFRGSFEDGGQAAMKKKYSIVFTAVLLCAAALIALSIGTGYFNFISQQIYADSTGNLEELYTQVNRSFAAFVQRNWGLLESWRRNTSGASGTTGASPSSIFLRRTAPA